MEGKVNPVTPVANVSANKDTKESNVTNAKADTTKVVVLANLAMITVIPTEVNPATPIHVIVNKVSLETDVILV